MKNSQISYFHLLVPVSVHTLASKKQPYKMFQVKETWLQKNTFNVYTMDWTSSTENTEQWKCIQELGGLGVYSNIYLDMLH